MFDVIANRITDEVSDIYGSEGIEVAEYVLARFREIMIAQEVVLYQP